jgi:hypothetical protein
MRLEQEFTARALRSLLGQVVLPARAAELTTLLDSVEEFLAWIILRENGLAELSEELTDIARTAQQSPLLEPWPENYPLEANKATLALDEAVQAIINQGKDAAHQDKAAAHALKAFYDGKMKTELHLRHVLGIETT